MKTLPFYTQLYKILKKKKKKKIPNCNGKLSWQRDHSAQCKHANSFTNEESATGIKSLQIIYQGQNKDP